MERRGAMHEAVDYPVRDETPMGETDRHRDELKDYALNVLLDHVQGHPHVYVSGNNFVYYRQGDPSAVVSPDTYVVRGVEQRSRDSFRVWEEGGHRPCFVLEITSRSTRANDLGVKMFRYRDELEVPEYFLFDPNAEWIPERLRGFALGGGVYRPLTLDGRGRLASAQLGLELGVLGEHLRFFEPGAEEPLPTRAERAERAEARAARLEAELRRLRAEE